MGRVEEMLEIMMTGRKEALNSASITRCFWLLATLKMEDRNADADVIINLVRRACGYLVDLSIECDCTTSTNFLMFLGKALASSRVVMSLYSDAKSVI
jgi:hypothetical protein